VHQINSSSGGVPKSPIGRALVDALGIAGDKHNDRRHHGGPERALCLYALEIIDALRAEGHPIEPGSSGENVTTRGLDWSLLEPGCRLRLGPILIEFADWASPCETIAHCFEGHEFIRASHKLNPGWSRAYVKVLEAGYLAPGDGISVLARSSGADDGANAD
jgi:MOSC domain-containing protein YiiM